MNRRAVLGIASIAALEMTTPPLDARETMTDQIARILNAYAEAWRAGDIATLSALYHDEFTLHYPGSHSLAGVHVGKAASLAVLREVGLRTQRRLVAVIDVMAGSQRGALQVRENWTDRSGAVDVDRVFVYTVLGDQLRECWLFDADQDILKRFLGPARL